MKPEDQGFTIASRVAARYKLDRNPMVSRHPTLRAVTFNRPSFLELQFRVFADPTVYRVVYQIDYCGGVVEDAVETAVDWIDWVVEGAYLLSCRRVLADGSVLLLDTSPPPKHPVWFEASTWPDGSDEEDMDSHLEWAWRGYEDAGAPIELGEFVSLPNIHGIYDARIGGRPGAHLASVRTEQERAFVGWGWNNPEIQLDALSMLVWGCLVDLASHGVRTVDVEAPLLSRHNPFEPNSCGSSDLLVWNLRDLRNPPRWPLTVSRPHTVAVATTQRSGKGSEVRLDSHPRVVPSQH